MVALDQASNARVLTLCAVSPTRGSAKKNCIEKNEVGKIIDEAYRCKF
jgi:hypothetical protein